MFVFFFFLMKDGKFENLNTKNCIAKHVLASKVSASRPWIRLTCTHSNVFISFLRKSHPSCTVRFQCNVYIRSAYFKSLQSSPNYLNHMIHWSPTLRYDLKLLASHWPVMAVAQSTAGSLLWFFFWMKAGNTRFTNQVVTFYLFFVSSWIHGYFLPSELVAALKLGELF